MPRAQTHKYLIVYTATDPQESGKSWETVPMEIFPTQKFKADRIPKSSLTFILQVFSSFSQ